MVLRNFLRDATRKILHMHEGLAKNGEKSPENGKQGVKI